MKTEELKVEITRELARKCHRLNVLTKWLNVLKTCSILGVACALGLLVPYILGGSAADCLICCAMFMIPAIMLDRYISLEIHSRSLDEELDQAVRMARLKQGMED